MRLVQSRAPDFFQIKTRYPCDRLAEVKSR